MNGVDASRPSELGAMVVRILPHTVPLAIPRGFQGEVNVWCVENIQGESDLPPPHSVSITEDYLRRRRWIVVMEKCVDGLRMRYYFETADDAFQFKMRWG